MGLPIPGVDALCLLDIQDSSLPTIKVSSTTQTWYFVVISKWHDVTKVPSTAEHVEFLWVLLMLICFFPNSGKLSIEYLLERDKSQNTCLVVNVYWEPGPYPNRHGCSRPDPFASKGA